MIKNIKYSINVLFSGLLMGNLTLNLLKLVQLAQLFLR